LKLREGTQMSRGETIKTCAGAGARKMGQEDKHGKKVKGGGGVCNPLLKLFSWGRKLPMTFGHKRLGKSCGEGPQHQEDLQAVSGIGGSREEKTLSSYESDMEGKKNLRLKYEVFSVAKVKSVNGKTRAWGVEWGGLCGDENTEERGLIGIMQ